MASHPDACGDAGVLLVGWWFLTARVSLGHARRVGRFSQDSPSGLGDFPDAPLAMASERVRRILVSKGAPFDDDELARMSDADGWAWIYGNAPRPEPRRPEVCFTGFRPSEKAELRRLAEAAGYRVAKTVTKRLAILCTGPTAGPAKLAKAKKVGAEILDPATLRFRCSEGTEK